jgi:hypothetical protein
MKRTLLLASLTLAATVINVGGAHVASASCSGDRIVAASVTAYSPPSPPANLMVAAGNRSVVLFWDPPDNDGGGVDFYRVYVDGVSTLQTKQTQTRVSNLTNGQEYSFYVTAMNDCGESGPSETVTATPSADQRAEIIGGNNLSMKTGKEPTAADPFVTKQTFPAGTTGIGTLQEEPDNGFCDGSCLAGSVLVNSLQDGSLGGPSYIIRLAYDRTVVNGTDGGSFTATATGTSGFTVYYDPTKGETPIQLQSCSVSSTPCVAKLARDDGDLIVQVRTADIDPRLGTRT